MSEHSDMSNHSFEVNAVQELYRQIEVLCDVAGANRTMRPCQIVALIQAKETMSNLVEILAPQCPFTIARAYGRCCEQLTQEVKPCE